MKFVGNFYSSNAEEKFQLEVNITGIDYLNKENRSCLERGLDNYISNSFFDDLTDVAIRIFEYLNNCEISKKDFDLTITLVELKNAISAKDENGNTSLAIYFDEQNCPYRKEIVSYKEGEFQSYLLYDNTDGIKQFDYSKVKSFIALDNPENVIQDFVNIELNKIEELKKAAPVRLDVETRNLIKAYGLFYNEIFNVQDEHIMEKLKYMLYILNSNSIKLFEEPISLYSSHRELEKTFYKLKNTRIVACDSSSDNLADNIKLQISRIGYIINNFIIKRDDNSFVQSLYNFCSVIQTEEMQKGNAPSQYHEPLRLIREITKNNAKN